MSRGLLLLLSFAEHKVITNDSNTQNMVVSGIFISLSWVYLATFKVTQQQEAKTFKSEHSSCVVFQVTQQLGCLV